MTFCAVIATYNNQNTLADVIDRTLSAIWATSLSSTTAVPTAPLRYSPDMPETHA